MIKYILTFLLVIIASSLLALNGQIALDLSTDDDEGITSRLSSYLSTSAAGWLLINTTQLKYSETDQTLSRYYRENRALNLLSATKIKQNWSVNFFAGITASYDDNFPTEIAGSSDQYEHESTISLGGNYLYDNQKIYFSLKAEQLLNSFTRIDMANRQESEIAENDLIYSTAAGYWVLRDLLITANYEQFNDLNENNAFNYADYYLKAQYDKKLSYIHYIDQSLRLGYSDLDAELNYYLQTRTRLSSKFSPAWTMLNIIAWRGWIEEESTEVYLGNSWYETNLRYNLSVSDRNQLSFAETGYRIDFNEQVSIFSFAGRYYLNNFKLYTADHLFTGTNRWQNYELSIGTGYEFSSGYKSISYEFSFEQDNDDEETLQHSIKLAYSF